MRVPRNGREREDWLIKQMLDLGVYGIVFPMVETAEDVRHLLGAMRFPAPRGARPDGITGRVAAGHRFLMVGPERHVSTLLAGRRAAGRD